jgi:hypothetical protein
MTSVTFDLKLSIYLDTVAEREHFKLGTANNCFLITRSQVITTVQKFALNAL